MTIGGSSFLNGINRFRKPDRDLASDLETIKDFASEGDLKSDNIWTSLELDWSPGSDEDLDSCTLGDLVGMSCSNSGFCLCSADIFTSVGDIDSGRVNSMVCDNFDTKAVDLTVEAVAELNFGTSSDFFSLDEDSDGSLDIAMSFGAE